MKKKRLVGLLFAAMAIGFFAAVPARAQSAYFQAVTNLNPAGYWPMHEVAVPASGDVETNLGSLGSLGNGYYADWLPVGTPITTHSVAGALAGDTDPAVFFNGVKNAGGQGYVLIPTTAPEMTLKPPFTLEAWVQPGNLLYADLIGQFGYGLNPADTKQRRGVRVVWAGNFQFMMGSGTSTPGISTPTYAADGSWYHFVVTHDGTTATIYVNGVYAASGAVSGTPDGSIPFTIGNGFWANGGPQRAYNGAIDEVAIYTYALDYTQVLAHYDTGINPSPVTSYKDTVLVDSPVVYLRMNGPAYTAPDVSTWPVLTNYGSVALNGAYSPGSMPGFVDGPGFGGVSGQKVMPGNGMSSYATAGYDPAFDPTTTPFSFGAWFKGNPADCRSSQTIMGHSDLSWRAAMNKSGQLQVHGAGAPDIYSPVVNDGNWHQFILTTWPTNAATGTAGTNILYVDGAEVARANSSALNVGTNADVILGNDPQFLSGTTIGRSFAGQMCEAAFWSRMLSPSEVVALYDASGVPPYITPDGQLPVTYTNLCTLFAGASPTFAITSAMGSHPMTYQWYSNGVMVPDATNSTFTMSDVPAGGLTNYCVLANSAGTATSLVWTAQVVLAPTAPYPQSALGLNPLGYWRLNEPDNEQYDGNPGAVAHDYMGGNDGYYTNALLGQAGYHWTTDPTTSAQFGYIAMTDSAALGIQGVDFSSPTNTSRAFTVAAWVMGQPSQVNGAGLVTKGYGNGGEQFDLDVYNQGFRFFVRDSNGGVHAYTDNDPARALDGNWHHVVGVCDEPNGVVSLYIDGYLAGQSAIAPGSGILATSHPMSIGARRSSSASAYDFTFVGNMNDVAVYGYALSAEQVRASYLIAGVAPHFPLQPTNTTIYESETLTIQTDALGTEPVSYQWYDFITGPLTDQTNTTLVLSNVPISLDGDTFYLAANNAYGSVYSAYATLTVLPGTPVINSQLPAGDFSIYQSYSSTLLVSAVGVSPLSYQWYTNGVADTAAGTGPTYLVTNAQPAMSGTTFQCIVTNAFGTASSTAVTLTVLQLPSAMANSGYSTNVMALNPTAYWPMHETTPPVPGDVETNYGTLGAAGNGYYADWNVNSGYPGDQVIQHQIAGALANDSDGAAMFNFNGNTNSYLLVPHTSPGATLRPPFTIECWVWSSDTGFGDIVSQDGTRLNVGNANNYAGIRVCWNRGNNIQTYASAGGLTGGTSPLNQWNYVVVTYDGTNQILYVNGTNSASVVHTGYVVDYWDPLTIGNGMWNNNGPTRAATHLAIDEVAIYDKILDATTVSNRYDLGSTGLAGEYFTAVTNSEPVLYYRMDAPAYNMPDSSTWPVMTNYGTVAINGTYQPGLAPGSYEGPSSDTTIAADGLAAANSAPMSGMSTFASATPPDASVFSPPTGTSPFSFSLWFKSNPSDCRYQTLLSQGDGWQLAQQENGTLQFYLGSSGWQNTTGVYNDGNWHHVVVTYATNTGNIYVDGALDSTKTDSTLINPAPAVYALGIGCDTRFTPPNYSGGAGRQYAGNICEVAFWNGTELDAGQVQALYNAAGMPPRITMQPVSASVDQGAAFTSTVAAVGSEPLAYQWYHEGQPRNDQTSASLELASVQLADAGSWYVVVTNASGAATSSVVTLTVIPNVPTLSLDRVGSDWVITYTGTLLSSTDAAGPYEPVVGANSPYTVPMTDAQRFYRTSNP